MKNDQMGSKEDMGNVLPALFQRLREGDETDVNKFIAAYIERGKIIIEHYPLYKEFADKLPLPVILAHKALQNFAACFSKGEEIDPSYIWDVLRKALSRHVKSCISNDLKELCIKVYQGVPDALKLLMDYQINVLLVIDEISKNSMRNFIFNDHMLIAEKVMNKFVEHVKEFGPNDKHGNEIKDYFSYLFVIIRARIIEQYRRERKTVQFPEEGQDNIISGFFLGANDTETVVENVYKKEFKTAYDNGLLTVLTDVERFIVIESVMEERDYRYIIGQILIRYGIDISVANYYRTKKQALLKLRGYFEGEHGGCLAMKSIKKHGKYLDKHIPVYPLPIQKLLKQNN